MSVLLIEYSLNLVLSTVNSFYIVSLFSLIGFNEVETKIRTPDGKTVKVSELKKQKKKIRKIKPKEVPGWYMLTNKHMFHIIFLTRL